MAKATDTLDTAQRMAERIESVGIKGLTPEETHYHAIRVLEEETSNGSFHQFFWNHGDLALPALQGLRAVGATKMADALAAAIALFPNATIPPTADERKKLLDQFSPAQTKELDTLSDRFSDYPDPLCRLLNAYVKKNAAAFLGPKTQMDLWESRRDRGADTQPRRLNKHDLDKEAAHDAKLSSRTCPQCSQPCPSYRMTCKRCGYPLGRQPPASP
jgi:hypothetical protein